MNYLLVSHFILNSEKNKHTLDSAWASEQKKYFLNDTKEYVQPKDIREYVKLQKIRVVVC